MYLMMVPSERYLEALIHANRTIEYLKIYIIKVNIIYIYVNNRMMINKKSIYYVIIEKRYMHLIKKLLFNF
jgi:hypothetical protein